MIESIKEKIHATNDHQQKITLLTLAPKSWTLEKSAKYFSASIRSVKSARELIKSSGILPNKSNRIRKVLCQKYIISVNSNDEFSRVCPGKKSMFLLLKSMVEGNIQKHLLSMNLKELHIEFLKRYNKKIHLSKFCELKPKWCILLGEASGLHTV